MYVSKILIQIKLYQFIPVVSEEKSQQHLVNAFHKCVQSCLQLSVLTARLLRLQLCLMSQCSGSIKGIKRVSLILDDDEQPEELGLTGLTASEKQSGERRFNVDMMRLTA